IYVAAFRARTGLHRDWPAFPAAPPLSASCSSDQRFACGFLPIPSRDGHRCRSANTSPCRVCRGLSPPSECALPGAPNEKAFHWSGRPDSLRLTLFAWGIHGDTTTLVLCGLFSFGLLDAKSFVDPVVGCLQIVGTGSVVHALDVGALAVHEIHVCHRVIV